MKKNSYRNLTFSRRLEEGFYQGYIKSMKGVVIDGSNLLKLSCVVKDGNRTYKIDKYFPTDDGKNDKLYYFLDEIRAIKKNGHVDWDSITQYSYEMEVYIDSKSKKTKIGEIHPLYEDQKDEYEGYEEDDDGDDYYEE